VCEHPLDGASEGVGRALEGALEVSRIVASLVLERVGREL
jgi:hypothetical protein